MLKAPLFQKGLCSKLRFWLHASVKVLTPHLPMSVHQNVKKSETFSSRGIKIDKTQCDYFLAVIKQRLVFFRYQALKKPLTRWWFIVFDLVAETVNNSTNISYSSSFAVFSGILKQKKYCSNWTCKLFTWLLMISHCTVERSPLWLNWKATIVPTLKQS